MGSESDDLHRKTVEFVRLLKQHDHRISAFIFALVPNWNDAQDLIQETSVRIWEQFHEYRTGADFGAWACTIARYMVLAYRKKMQRSRLQFRPEIIEMVAAEFDSAAAVEQSRLQALGVCLNKLDEASRELLRRCYAKGAKIKEIAQRAGRSVNGVYTFLSRIRKALHDCVQSEMSDGGIRKGAAR
jgi:RNA polymerase sigma-70 factor (ECF subfamily)